jgi:hypothetical protein
MAAKKSRATSTKFAREAKLRERRRAKEARRDARKLLAADGEPVTEKHAAPDANTDHERPVN